MKRKIFYAILISAAAICTLMLLLIGVGLYVVAKTEANISLNELLPAKSIMPILIITAVIVVFAAVLLAGLFSKKIVDPLKLIDLDRPLLHTQYSELEPLLRRVDLQKRQLHRQQEKLARKQEQFDTATSSMNEGLILLNLNGTVLSINRAARRILGANKSCIGTDITTVNSSFDVKNLLKSAQNARSGEIIVEINSRQYQIDANPVISENKVSGVAMLLFDITEKEDAEQVRREFTANVSHELKTPLQSISGYAELLKNSMVRPEDIGAFAEKIYSQSQRMIRLIEDIIYLSRLDEGAKGMQFCEIDLYALALQTVESLALTAQKAEVSIKVEGEPQKIHGISQLVSGIIFNLCDNAIKYNRCGGSVKVLVFKDKNDAVLTVSDTGIGIAEEDIRRIFERFYRVDKSRSNEVGGTGLGLSIVKHAAKIHNAAVDIKSKIGEGTVISVRFSAD